MLTKKNKMSFVFDIVKSNIATIVNFKGRLMEANDNQEITAAIDAEIKNGVVNFILNLENLEYMNSSGINVFVSILTKSRNNGGDTIICNVSNKINQLLIITKLNSVFTVTDSTEKAIEKLSETANV